MDKLSKLEEIVKVLDKDVPTNKDVAEVIGAVLKVIKEVKDILLQKVEDSSSEMSRKHSKLVEEVEGMEEGMKKMHGKMSSEMDGVVKKVYLAIQEVKNLIPPATDLSLLENRIDEVEKKIPTIPDKITPEQVRDKLENLEGDERLVVDSIKGLKEELERIAGTARTRGVFSSIRRVYQPYVDDFSAQTNGSTKIFYLSRAPLKSDTVLVWGTDFPVILRPTTDFTVAGKTLTLTTAVPAPSSGATLLVRYDA